MRKLDGLLFLEGMEQDPRVGGWVAEREEVRGGGGGKRKGKREKGKGVIAGLQRVGRSGCMLTYVACETSIFPLHHFAGWGNMF